MAKCRKCKKYDQKAKWCELIRRQPTAYDVGKVLEEIKKLGTTFCTCNCDNCECPDCEQGTMMKLIIEAVKEGGINGRENDA